MPATGDQYTARRLCMQRNRSDAARSTLGARGDMMRRRRPRRKRRNYLFSGRAYMRMW